MLVGHGEGICVPDETSATRARSPQKSVHGIESGK
jgi:hypothetical protein